MENSVQRFLKRNGLTFDGVKNPYSVLDLKGEVVFHLSTDQIIMADTPSRTLRMLRACLKEAKLK